MGPGGPPLTDKNFNNPANTDDRLNVLLIEHNR